MKIRVNPASVQSYGKGAGATFEKIHGELVALVNHTVEVHYFGPNSVQFKTECGRLATEFAMKLHKDIAGMADAVRVSTSNIAKSLGGQPISITVNNKAVTAPKPKTVDYVDVDTAALEGLVPVVNKHFQAIHQGLQEHLKSLKSTDWEGSAKTEAVNLVSGFTSKAIAACDEAKGSINEAIRKQIDSVLAADK